MSEYNLVPFEPTQEMVAAAEEAYMPFGDMSLAIRMAILAAPAAQQPAPDVAGLVEALEGILPYVVDEPWECRGDKCRELWCISCYGDEEACESAAKAKQAIHKAVSALAAHRKQRDES